MNGIMAIVDRCVDVVTRACSTLAAFWALALGFLILYDISGRAFFNKPFDGTIELVANSMVSILFLLMPYAIFRGAHIRTTAIYQGLGPYGQRAVDLAACLLGIYFFWAVADGGWADMIIGWEVDEREGEGSIRVPVYPVRTIIIAFAIMAMAIYAILAIHVLLGTRPQMINEKPEEEPGQQL